MKPIAEKLSGNFGILELIQTEKTVNGQIEELHNQLIINADLPITLVGYSWGAWLGFLFTSNYPDLVKKLILVSSGAFEERYNKNLMNKQIDKMGNNNNDEIFSFLISLIFK